MKVLALLVLILSFAASGHPGKCDKDEFRPVIENTEFTLPPLPYGYRAMEPAISTDTMTTHHDAHHQGYVNKLNTFIADNPELCGLEMPKLLSYADDYVSVKNNGGGHYNHSLFWWVMTCPSNHGNRLNPASNLYREILESFGTFEDF
jgi:Fe-Mn family superoxide dismutase